jgi:CubicO group peptidase (beta-lactamase class C family)
VKKTIARLAFLVFSFAYPTYLLGMTDVYSQSIDEYVTSHITEYPIPGLSLAIIRDGKIKTVYTYGYSNFKKKIKVVPQTLFQAASISKSVTAVATVIAFSEKKLDLNSPANRLITGWQLKNPYAKTNPVTVRLLLAHAAGITGERYLGYTPGQPVPTTIQILSGKKPANTPKVTVVARPDTKTIYSPFGYTIIQAILEDIYDESFASILDQLILKPFYMKESTFRIKSTPIHDNSVALPYNSRKWNKSHRDAISNPPPAYAALAAGGLWTTPTDLAHFILSFQAALAGQQIGGLKPDLAREMMKPSDVSPNWGLGFEVNVTCNGSMSAKKTDYFTHSGQNAGYVSLLIGSQHDHNGLVIMINSGPSMEYGARGKIKNFDFLQDLAAFIAKQEKWTDCSSSFQ